MPVMEIKPTFSAGELSPALWGRVDFPAFKAGASVYRNCYVNYRGPASSRAGTLYAIQTLTPASASSLPPKIINFQFNIFQSYILEFGVGPRGPYMRVIVNGGAVTETPEAITGASQANPCVLSIPGNNYSAGDWLFLTGLGGMTQLNGRTVVAESVSGNNVTLFDTFGKPINSLGYGDYTSGGTAARIFTTYSSPYQLVDLPYLKVVQSADVMTLCCVNQETGTEYPPIDLARLAANNWTFTENTFASAIAAPTGCTAATSVTATPATQYAYCVTAVDASTGEESIASNIAYITTSDDIAIVAGSHTITWNPVAGAAYYNVYQAPPAYDAPVPVGSVFGYLGSATGTQLVNTNIEADLSQTPPTHSNPFARGQVISIAMTNQGSGYSQSTVSVTINTTTGSGAVLIPVVVGGAIVAVIVQDAGTGYLPSDTLTFNGQIIGSGASATFTASATDGAIETTTIVAGGSHYIDPTVTAPSGSGATFVAIVQNGAIVDIYWSNSGSGYPSSGSLSITDSAPGGSGATGTLDIGPENGTYPACPAYFQSRRVYANTLNNPDTLYGSQTGAYQNMDSSTPPIDSDAIITTPWGQQVDGIQFMQPMPGGLILGTGLDAWQLSGSGGAGSTWTPASQSAQPQESNGFSPTVPPIKINYDILYVQSLGTVVRDLQYNFFVNIYAGTDISILSSHLFDGFQIVSWAWAKVPWKIVWATRDDGKFLSLTFDKEEQLKGWSRHDTNGLVVGNAVATEPPVDAPYFIVKRYIVGQMQWAYYIERMDNRLWTGPEDPWCVDAALALDMPEPNATLTAAAAEGPGTITGGYLPNGGQNYTNPSAQIYDPAGTGSGGSIAFTLTDGVITSFDIVPGQDYSPGTTVKIVDETGAGATFVPIISQNVLFNASAAVFAGNNPGDVIRIGGGQAVVTTVNSPTQVLAAITVPIVDVVPDDPNFLPMPAASGEWSITTPVSEVTGLYHLEGMQVTGLADGQVIPLTIVENGSITLAEPASNIKVGLPFIAQLQSMHPEMPQLGSIQGERKRIASATVRMQASRGFQVFANQPVASALDFQQEIPWANGVAIPEVPNVNVPASALPLFTGDCNVRIDDDWQNYDGFQASPGFIGVQQLLPLPLDVLALVPVYLLGDNKDPA